MELIFHVLEREGKKFLKVSNEDMDVFLKTLCVLEMIQVVFLFNINLQRIYSKYRNVHLNGHQVL